MNRETRAQGLTSRQGHLVPLALLILTLVPVFLHAAPPRTGTTVKVPGNKFPTLGGSQFWTDQLVFHGWRIQRNALTQHHRLLDEKNYRHTWGQLEHCRQTLEQIKAHFKLPPIQGKVILVLHGLGRTRNSMNQISQFLQKQEGYTVLQMSYASTRGRVADHARALHQVIRGLPEAKEINFVAHSLGNLVIRHYLHDVQKQQLSHPPLGSMVMLAPPNQGSSMAQQFKNNKAVRAVWGASGNEIASDWPRLSQHLAIPRFRFGIIAGQSSNSKVDNPLLKGKDDLVVTVAETRLPGAHDFLVAPAVHTYLMDHPQVHAATLRFLTHGYFLSEAQRQPIQARSGKP